MRPLTPITRLGALLLLTLAGAAPARAQSWRTLDVSRQLHDSAACRVLVKYTAGTLDLHPATAPSLLYQMQLRYDEGRAAPVHRFDADSRLLALGVERATMRLGRLSSDRAGALRVGLTTAVPLDLSLDLIAVDGRADLSGLRIDNLAVEVAASDASIVFRTPNPTAMRQLDVAIKTGTVHLVGLANANTSTVSVHGGLGAAELDFDGQWTRDVDVDADISVGQLRVRVPADVGVRVDASRFLASFDHAGLEKRGDAWYSANWDEAKYHLHLRSQTTLGQLAIERSQE